MHLPHLLFLMTAVTGASVAQDTKLSPVIELFSSEGCSSCPPAERVISSLNAEQSQGDDTPIIIVYAVDYWNRLGWVDPFSDRRHSVRQEHYAKWGVSKMFTPALIINGSTTVVGSDEPAVREALAAARGTSARSVLQLTVDWKADTVTGTISSDRSAAGVTYSIALVQDGVEQKIPRGENRGRTLIHDRLCRAIVTLASTGRWVLPLPQPADRAASHIVAFEQQDATGLILGARQISCK